MRRRPRRRGANSSSVLSSERTFFFSQRHGSAPMRRNPGLRVISFLGAAVLILGALAIGPGRVAATTFLPEIALPVPSDLSGARPQGIAISGDALRIAFV